ncbi:hypothetical protein AB0G20_10285 [Streptomyces sp. NPDC024017]|uniref:hypothetical protein n=1 Tax=Streptomyces sp. NPDC024017 TaxID=3154326 RepID=UPI0033EC6C26
MSAVIVGVGGLLLTGAATSFNGVATYFQWQVSADQLSQSKEDSERRERAQAMLVSYWVAVQGDKWRVHVMNRSPDPVTNVAAWVVVPHAIQDPPTKIQPLAEVRYTLAIGDLAPCSEAVYDKKQFKQVASVTGSNGRRWETAFSSEVRPRVQAAHFYDRDGKGWNRRHNKLNRLDVKTIRDIPRFDGWQGDISGGPAAKRAATCATPAQY